MAKALKTAAIVVGAVALIVGTAGVLAPAATAGALGALGVTAGAASVAAVASIAASALSLGAGLVAKKPSAQATGSQMTFNADPDAFIPLVIGRMMGRGIVRWRSAT